VHNVIGDLIVFLKRHVKNERLRSVVPSSSAIDSIRDTAQLEKDTAMLLQAQEHRAILDSSIREIAQLKKEHRAILDSSIREIAQLKKGIIVLKAQEHANQCERLRRRSMHFNMRDFDSRTKP
jgi:hypothetical protein